MDTPMRDLTDGAQLEIERDCLMHHPYLETPSESGRVTVVFVGGPLDGDVHAYRRTDLLWDLRVPLLGVEHIGRFARYRLRQHEYHYEGEE